MPAAGSADWTRAARRWLQALRPAPQAVDSRERMRAAVGAGVGLLVTALVGHWLAPHFPALPWLVAPLGASAVLVFAVPASPLAQPWAVLGGNTLSALVGVACGLWIPDMAWAAPIAGGLAIGVMFACRCLHPPGGAMALTAVLAQAHTAQFAAFPALTNSLILVLAGMAYNSLTGRAYPHRQRATATPAGPAEDAGFSADLDAALQRYNQVLDISRADLEALLHDAQLQSWRRRLGELNCGAIMTRDVVTVHFGTLLQDAWALMRQRRVKALPVVDQCHRVIGIITLADFMRHADLDVHEGFGARLREFVRRTTSMHSDKPEVVGQIMTRQVRVASQHRPLADLVPLFTHGGHHHIPVVGERSLLVGMITQSDFMRALEKAVGQAWHPADSSL